MWVRKGNGYNRQCAANAVPNRNAILARYDNSLAIFLCCNSK